MPTYVPFTAAVFQNADDAATFSATLFTSSKLFQKIIKRPTKALDISSNNFIDPHFFNFFACWHALCQKRPSM